MRHAILTALVAAVPLLDPAPPAARACAGGTVTELGTVSADAQRIFIAARGDATDVVVQVSVPVSSEDYAVLFPLPAAPTLDTEPVDVADLESLDRQTQVELVNRGDGGGIGCGAGAAGGDGIDDDVTIGTFATIGPLDAVTISGDTSGAITSWLNDNGFVVPAGQDSLLDPYVGADRWFLALRRSVDADANAPSSVAVHFTLPGRQLVLPMRFARLGAADKVSFVVFVAADTLFGPMGDWTTIATTDLDRDVVRDEGYAQAVDDAVQAAGGRAFVVEAVRGTGRWTAPGRLAALVDGAPTLTRLSTIVRPEDLTADAALFPSDVPAIDVVDVTEDERGCRVSSGRASIPGAALLGLALAALVALRRRPR
jgi:hypothetical protein